MVSSYEARRKCARSAIVAGAGRAPAGTAGGLARWRRVALLPAAVVIALGATAMRGYGGEAFAQGAGLADVGRPEVPPAKVQCLTMVSPRYPLVVPDAGKALYAGKASGAGKSGAGKDAGAATAGLAAFSVAIPVAVPVATPVTVMLRVTISKAGTVVPVRLVEGDQAFAAEAMDAVRLWRYRPYVRDGEAIEVATDVRVEFVPGRAAGLVSHPGR